MNATDANLAELEALERAWWAETSPDGSKLVAGIIADWLEEHGDEYAATMAREGWPLSACIVFRASARRRGDFLAEHRELHLG